MLLGTQRINEQGHLEIGGCDTVELAARFGTPLYIMDKEQLRRNCRDYRRVFESRYPNTAIAYAAKAFLCLAMVKLIEEEGIHLDLCSGGEMHTAMRAGFPMDRVVLHGNNKADWELAMALEAGVGRIVVDSLQELEQLQLLAQQRNQQVDILIRITPGIKARTHALIQTGHIDTKFGMAIETGQAFAGVRRALELPNLRLRGVHCHIGSQVFGLRFFELSAETMLSFVSELRVQLGYTVEELDLGGGLGVRYQSTDEPPNLEQYADAVVIALRKGLDWHNLRPPRLMLEPGRWLVGECGLTLYTVGVTKEIPGVRKYAAVDGGLFENPRPALYQAEYEAIVANKASQPHAERVTVAGKHCETDILIYDLDLPKVEPGDILAVQTTGAYNYSMSSNYNRMCRPAVVFAANGQANVVVERETLDTLIQQDRLPERAKAAAGS